VSEPKTAAIPVVRRYTRAGLFPLVKITGRIVSDLDFILGILSILISIKILKNSRNS
jgi:hypothetical protein